jgi:hypothetical protein
VRIQERPVRHFSASCEAVPNLEDFIHVPHLDLIWVYPLFWIFVLVAFPVVWLRYR